MLSQNLAFWVKTLFFANSELVDWYLKNGEADFLWFFWSFIISSPKRCLGFVIKESLHIFSELQKSRLSNFRKNFEFFLNFCRKFWIKKIWELISKFRDTLLEVAYLGLFIQIFSYIAFKNFFVGPYFSKKWLFDPKWGFPWSRESKTKNFIAEILVETHRFRK
jgi:hypothetical protein